MRPSTTARFVLLSLLTAAPLLMSSCDGGPTDQDFPACQPNTLRLQGSIDGMSVDITVPGEGGGLSQDGSGGELQSQAATVPDTSLTSLHLTWNQGITNGASGDATGTLTMVTGPFAGQTFCAGNGSQVHIPSDGSVAIAQFELTGLATGQGCTASHTGTLKGCMN
jgi:hypothetical protein